MKSGSFILFSLNFRSQNNIILKSLTCFYEAKGYRVGTQDLKLYILVVMDFMGYALVNLIYFSIYILLHTIDNFIPPSLKGYLGEEMCFDRYKSNKVYSKKIIYIFLHDLIIFNDSSPYALLFEPLFLPRRFDYCRTSATLRYNE